MDLQLIEAYLPKKYFEKVNESIQKFPHETYWISYEPSDRMHVRILVETTDTEEILNYFENIATVIDGFEIMLLPVHAYITRAPNEDKYEVKKEKETDTKQQKVLRASRQELFSLIQRSSNITLNYTLLVILAAIVVTIGFIKNSEAIVIGAMVIAPMLGPATSIAFSSIIGNFKLLWRSALTLSYAILLVIGISILFSFFFEVPIENREFTSRTVVSYSDIILALASGTAGALSFLNRTSGALVGVMVAVALMPPTVVIGMTLGEGMWQESFLALLLLLVNVNAILLSAILVFTLSGIRPAKWHEVKKAQTSTKLSIVFVSIIIIILASAISLSQNISVG